MINAKQYIARNKKNKMQLISKSIKILVLIVIIQLKLFASFKSRNYFSFFLYSLVEGQLRKSIYAAYNITSYQKRIICRLSAKNFTTMKSETHAGYYMKQQSLF
jgi:hypothetical protein